MGSKIFGTLSALFSVVTFGFNLISKGIGKVYDVAKTPTGLTTALTFVPQAYGALKETLKQVVSRGQNSKFSPLKDVTSIYSYVADLFKKNPATNRLNYYGQATRYLESGKTAGNYGAYSSYVNSRGVTHDAYGAYQFDLQAGGIASLTKTARNLNSKFYGMLMDALTDPEALKQIFAKYKDDKDFKNLQDQAFYQAYVKPTDALLKKYAITLDDKQKQLLYAAEVNRGNGAVNKYLQTVKGKNLSFTNLLGDPNFVNLISANGELSTRVTKLEKLYPKLDAFAPKAARPLPPKALTRQVLEQPLVAAGLLTALYLKSNAGTIVGKVKSEVASLKNYVEVVLPAKINKSFENVDWTGNGTYNPNSPFAKLTSNTFAPKALSVKTSGVTSSINSPLTNNQSSNPASNTIINNYQATPVNASVVQAGHPANTSDYYNHVNQYMLSKNMGVN